MGTLDVYLNIVGGLRLDDTACDLAVVLAVTSSLMDKAIPDDMLAIGEVGLGGEVRSVGNIDTRLREAARIGFSRVVLPKHSLAQLDTKQYPALELLGVSSIRSAIALL
ncbi:DNA repair protein RadA [bioreactor metagenome]|uniref:DNA repair protein RadA n=1 Tax=bioreactor metagenome TaxID=1076179 RepID=A0A645BZS6_9ZZZZ